MRRSCEPRQPHSPQPPASTPNSKSPLPQRLTTSCTFRYICFVCETCSVFLLRCVSERAASMFHDAVCATLHQSFRMLRSPDDRTLSNCALISAVNRLALPATLCLISHLRARSASQPRNTKERRLNAHFKEGVEVPLVPRSQGGRVGGVVGQQVEREVELRQESRHAARAIINKPNPHAPWRCLRDWNTETGA